MMIAAAPPMFRRLTTDELQTLETQGIDSSSLKGKVVELQSDEERAALERLIHDAQEAKSHSNPPHHFGSYINTKEKSHEQDTVGFDLGQAGAGADGE